MTEKMTETERLRALLDERGVEYETYHDAALTEVDAVFWQDRNGQPCSAIGNADDIPEMMLSVQCIISPEQAVEATLGRGTCRNISPKLGNDEFTCEECLARVYGSSGRWFDVNWEYHKFNFCPNCGRRVANEQ